jgi:hypothetical protein
MLDLENCKVRKLASCSARVATDEDGVETLISYETPVLRRYPDGTMVRLWTGSTMTTWKHIRTYCGLSADAYRALPLGKV